MKMHNLSNDLLNLSNFVGTITATAWSPLDRDLLSRVFFVYGSHDILYHLGKLHGTRFIVLGAPNQKLQVVGDKMLYIPHFISFPIGSMVLVYMLALGVY
jgi:hypothetical protein